MPWRFYNAGQGPIQNLDKLLLGGVIAIVSRVHPHVMPNRFDGIVLGTVWRQRAKMKAMSVATEPLLDFGGLVVRRVVMNEEDLLPAVALGQSREKHRIGLTLEDLPMCVIESGSVEIHCPKYLLGIALAGRRNQRLVSAPRPGLVEGRVLAETGLVAKEQRGLAFSGFFLAWDKCSAAIGPARPDRLWPTGGVAAAPRSPAP